MKAELSKRTAKFDTLRATVDETLDVLESDSPDRAVQGVVGRGRAGSAAAWRSGAACAAPMIPTCCGPVSGWCNHTVCRLGVTVRPNRFQPGWPRSVQRRWASSTIDQSRRGPPSATWCRPPFRGDAAAQPSRPAAGTGHRVGRVSTPLAEEDDPVRRRAFLRLAALPDSALALAVHGQRRRGRWG
jgi:hypothetical protein